MQIITLEAVMDNTPEVAEVFFVTLLEPTNLGRLSTDFTQATIEILPNQDPQGVLQIAAVALPLSVSLQVEENAEFINYEVTRSFGLFGEVTVAVETTSGTATSADGQVVSSAASQVFSTASAGVWYSFVSSSNADFLALGTASQVVLYGWRGVFTPVQVVSADGVTAFTAFSPASGEDILVVANGGAPGSREISSHVYRLTATEELSLVRQGTYTVVTRWLSQYWC